MNRPIVFCPDTGAAAGLGHLRRCHALAIALRGRGIESVFESDHPHPLAFVIDSYRANEFDLGAPVIAIDDIGDRPLPVDLVINPGIGAENLQYPDAKATALGIQYALLRPEFVNEPQRAHPAIARRLLLTLGGSDPHNLAPKLIDAVAGEFESVDVVVGPFFQDVKSDQKSVTLHRNLTDLRPLMLQCDMALTGGGQTVVELAATATPAVAIEIAPNQALHLAGFRDACAIDIAGKATDSDIIRKSAAAIVGLAGDREKRVRLAGNGRRVVDGRGADRAAERIIRTIEE